jgi:hypothetical protein
VVERHPIIAPNGTASAAGPVASTYAGFDSGMRVEEAPPPEPEYMTHAELFPADSTLARCMMSVAMARSDMALAVESARRSVRDGSPAFIYFHRLAIGHLYEALYALSRYTETHEDVQRFLKRLPESVRNELDQARLRVDQIGDALDHSRQHTFHYPHPPTKGGRGGESDDLLRRYLEGVAEGPVTLNEVDPTIRLEFGQMASFAISSGKYSADARVLHGQLEAGALGAGSYIRFADGALRTYLDLMARGKLYKTERVNRAETPRRERHEP